MDFYATAKTVADWLDSVPQRNGCTLFCADTDQALATLRDASARTGSPTTAITLQWEHPPRLADELGQAVRALAEATLSLYPALYASTNGAVTEVGVGSLEALESIGHRIPGVSVSAARRIIAACEAKRRPRLRHLPLAEQVGQLALALDSRHLLIQLAVHRDDGSDAQWLSLARGAEWLAQNARAKVVVVLPARLAGRAELDCVAYRSHSLATSIATQTTDVDETNLPELATREGHVVVQTHREERPAVTVATVRGQPHPLSEAERRLHERIRTDVELGGLFHYNQLVDAGSGMGIAPRVDLLWPEGRLVVEIDGFALHNRKFYFIADRDRDYHLLLSGYRVVRIADTEIDVDAERVVEKLRRLVRLLKRELQ